MIDRNKLTWKKNELYLGNKFLGRVVRDQRISSTYPELLSRKSMYRTEFSGMGLSEDFYNLSWAKENLVNMALSTLNKTREGEPVQPLR